MHEQEYSLRCSPLRASDERRVRSRTGGWSHPVPMIKEEIEKQLGWRDEAPFYTLGP